MIYFTADLHFYHDNVIRHTNRPFFSVEEMNAALIKNWNKKVKATDEVYILGDFTMKGAGYASEALLQLNGHKYLIKGNHDRFVEQDTFDCSLLEWVRDYHELCDQNERFVLFHYPIAEWNGSFRGAFHLHGHQHNHADYNSQNLEKGLRRFDVGVDANGMAPVSIDDVIAFFSLQDY